MFKSININQKKVFPTLVISTMSSGKSTLINALVGKELLPSKNLACTAKAVAVVDNDRKEEFEAHMVDKDGEYSNIKCVNKSIITKFNKKDDIKEIVLEGDIKGIRNSKKSLLLVDTPGINNSLDESHMQVTQDVLAEYKEGLILYVINAQQIGTYDDSYFLSLIVDRLKENPNLNIIFAVNKMDLIDPIKEDPSELIQNCKKYIEEKGIKHPVIVSVSASSALLFKKLLGGEALSETEEENFIRNYRHFKNDSFSLVNYSSTPILEGLEETINVDGKNYTKAQIYAALSNTGLTLLERVIEEQLISSLKMRSPKVAMRSTVK